VDDTDNFLVVSNLTLILVWGLCTVWQYFESFGRTEGHVENEMGRVNLGVVKTEFSVALPIGPDTVAAFPFLDPRGPSAYIT